MPNIWQTPISSTPDSKPDRYSGRGDVDLTIESLQDTSTYASKDKAVGGSVTFGLGFSASASYSSNKVNGDFASVTEQSGIQAGDGGFNIRVGGNTDLKGGVIASTQAAVDAGVNRLQTGTLTVSDITNTSRYEAKGISLSGGYAAGGSKDGAKTETQTPPTTNQGSSWSWQNQGSGAQGASAGFSSKSGSETSLTTSGISGGALVITDQAGQQAKTGQSVSDVLAALNRDVLTGDGANGLVKGWDGQKLQQQVSAGAEITATFGQQASREVGKYATNKAAQLRLQGNEEEAAKWDEGGEYRVAAHTAMGLLGGGAQGALGSATAATAAPILNELTKNLPDGVREAVGAGIAAGLGAAVGGSAGAATAFNEDANNRLLHPKEAESLNKFSEAFARHLNDGEEPSPDQIEEAKRRLTERALYQIDSAFSNNQSAKNDSQAAGFLNGLSEYFGPTSGDVGGGFLFDARGTNAYNNHTINSQYILGNFATYNSINSNNIKGFAPGYSGAYLAYASSATDRDWGQNGTTIEQAIQFVKQGNVLKQFASNGQEAVIIGAVNQDLFASLEHGGKLDYLGGTDWSNNWVIRQLIADTIEGPVGLGESGGSVGGRTGKGLDSTEVRTSSALHPIDTPYRGRDLAYEQPSDLVQARVSELQSQIPVNSQGRITMGVAVVEDADGVRSVVISTSEPRGYLRPGVEIQSGEKIISGTGHAEDDIVKYAKINGLKIIDIGATRRVCVSCQNVIHPTGANISTPLKPQPKARK